jgi:translation initiation factor 3 subunit C
MNNTLISVLEKLEIELYKSLQYTDQNSKEYILRIKDEITLIILCSKVLEYYKSNTDKSYRPRIYILILSHIYHKNEDQLRRIGEKLISQNVSDEYLKILAENPEKFMNDISNLLFSNSEEKSKLKAILLLITSYCLMNKYNKAHNFFKKCNYFDLITHLKDENIKILYNRTMVQLGLCAFRNGNYQDSLFYLMPLCQMGTSKLKEYLSQSYNKEMEKSIFFDKEDKKRIIPFIMIINIDEVECTFYLASLLLDLPKVLLYKLGKSSGNTVNLVFKKLMDNFEKQVI